MRSGRLSQLDRLLLALHRSCHGDYPPGGWPLSAIVLLAWRADPRAYGLEGHNDVHPDAKRVSAALSHLLPAKNFTQRVCNRRGWLRLVAPKRYAMTPEGAAQITRILELESQLEHALSA